MSESNHDPAVFPRAPRPGADVLGEPMRSRWSPSLFDPAHELTDAETVTLLRAAQWAPSWGNAQPWHWIVCLRGSVDFAHLEATLTRGNSKWVPLVSVVFVCVVQVEPVGESEPSPYALYDAGQAAAHLTLQARSMDLHAHQFAGFDHDEFARRLQVPSTHRVLSGVAVGSLGDPDTVAGADDRVLGKHWKPRVRRTLAEQAFEGAWGEPWTGLVRIAGQQTPLDEQGRLEP